jgi:hypothetical protein
MKQILKNGFRLNLDYTTKLVEDVPDEKMAIQPNGFTNHPKFTIGHLVTATALTGELLGAQYEVPEGWDELFRRKGPGDPQLPEKQKDKYPHKDELMKNLEEQANKVIDLINSAEPSLFEEEYKWKLHRYMPTIGDLLYFQCHIHHSWHIGQLAEWRRLMGYDSALAKLMT